MQSAENKAWSGHVRSVLFLSVLCFSGWAFALEGQGYGPSEEAARQAAVADLVSSIQVQVKAVVESCTQLVGKKAEDCGSRVLTRSVSDLPLLGLSFVKTASGREAFGARAQLLPETSMPLYASVLQRLNKDFLAGSAVLANTKGRAERYALLGRQLTTLLAIQDHRLVASALGLRSEEAPASEASLLAMRSELEDNADSLPYAAKLLLKELEGHVRTAEPLRPVNSREATPLGSALSDALRAELSTRVASALHLTGEYRLLDSGEVDVLLEVRDEATRRVLALRSVRLLKAAYAGYRAEPLAPDFEKLLRQGEAISGDLRAELVTTQGSQTLKFKSGESIKLAARLNRAGYFYVVGHVLRPDGQFSYLLPLQEGENDARFIRRIPADQANHYIEIGEFIIEPPYGTEHLQIIASSQPIKGVLPPYEMDPQSGYYKVSGSNGNAKAGLVKTRGLKPKVQAQAEAFIAESTLTFTTVEK